MYLKQKKGEVKTAKYRVYYHKQKVGIVYKENNDMLSKDCFAEMETIPGSGNSLRL